LGSSIVTMREVRLAYGSRTYSAYRKDIEDLASLAVSHSIMRRRPDLVCAFIERPMSPTTASAKPKLPPEMQAYPFDVSAALVESAISIDAQATLRTLRQSSESVSANESKAKMLRIPKRSVVSAQSLLEGASLFRQANDGPRPVSKKRKTKMVATESEDENTS
jgi:hypothetical protein